MANKRKTTTAIVAGVTALALLLGGTFAWTSISQQARNEAIVDINPGGRLHDDFNGTNKDVYVENFGDETTGVPIYARIRLDQYFEVGQDAGINKNETNRKVTQVLGTDINDVKSWVTYTPTLDENGNIDFDALQANDNWTWDMGNGEDNLPYYMPTFNMNKDSLAADINGTYEGKTEGDIVHYDDYVVYVDAEGNAKTVTGTEVYDWDDENADEEPNPNVTTDETAPRDSANVYHKENQTHTAKQIDSTATVITMQQWINDYNSQPGPYWVYDTDGWAYWAQAIEPGKTTGLLLDSISMSKVPDDNYYYGINVVGQFATAGDLSAFKSGTETMTPEAEDLFVKLTGTEEVVISGADTLLPGEIVTYTATRMALGGEAVGQPEFVWTATDIDGVTMENGTLTVADTVKAGTEITVTATASEAATLAEGETTALSASKTVTVKGELTITAANGTTVYYQNVTTSETFTATLRGATEEDGTVTWSVADSEGNSLTETAIDENGELTVGANETAPNIVVTATYKSNDGEVEFSGNYTIRSAVVETTNDLFVPAYALLTDDGSENGTYKVSYVRAEEAPIVGDIYNGVEVVAVSALGETDDLTSIDRDFDKYLSTITEITFGNTVRPTNTIRFSGMDQLKKVDLTYLDVSKTTDLTGAFYNLKSLETVTGLSSWNVSNVMYLVQMFYNCTSLTTVEGLDNWNVSNVAEMSGMFYNCTSLTSVGDLSNWKVSNVASMLTMFSGCASLTSVGDLSGWDVSSVTDMRQMFYNCKNLTVDCSKWDVSNVESHSNFATGAPGVTQPTAWQ